MKTNNKKHKKIQKQKPVTNKQQLIKDAQNQNNLQFEINQLNHPNQSQPLFQQLPNQDILDNDQQTNKILNNKSILIQKYEVANGWLFVVNKGKCYHAINRTNTLANIAIIDGSIDINGKTYYQLFGIKYDSSLVITVCEQQNKYNQKLQNVSHKQQNKYKQKISDNSKQNIKINKLLSYKQKQGNLNSITENQLLINNANKNAQYILNKIINNRYVVEVNRKNLSQINDETQQFKEQQNSLSITVSESVTKLIADSTNSQKSFLWTENKDISLLQCEQSAKPWHKISLPKYLQKNETTLLIGQKNTGKSMFCSYLQNKTKTNNSQICIIDLDIGRNRTYPGCISLCYRGTNCQQQNISVWIGEYTPLNSTSIYIKAIRTIYQYYKQKYFTVSLIINTMGYITGLGELILYEIFNIFKPQKVLFLQNPSTPQHFILKNIQNNIKSGKYTERLYFKQTQCQTQTSTNIQKYINYFASQKPAPQRFQSLISKHSPKSIEDLIFLIMSKKLKNLNKNVKKYQGNKEGSLSQINQTTTIDINMRLTILCKFWRDSQLLVKGVGFIWNNSIFYDPNIIEQQQVSIALIPDGIDFERTFYQINQSKLMQLELCFGYRLPFICPIFKGLGNKGMRNNPSKKILVSRV